jgi:heme exporter protein C
VSQVSTGGARALPARGAHEREMPAYEHTGSRASRIVGVLALGGAVALAVFGLVLSPADRIQEDAVRILYLHVPVALAMYGAVILLGVSSVMWLRKRTEAWDVLAAASAEVGMVFTGLTLLTGMLYGRPTWGVYWVWDARLTTTALLLVLLAGYLALRRVPAAAETRSRRSAIAGLLIVVDLPLIHYSVDWWRTLHQDATISTTDAKIDGLMLFTLFLGIVVALLVLWWLLLHRFRLAWLEEEIEQGGLDQALAERRAEAEVLS